MSFPTTPKSAMTTFSCPNIKLQHHNAKSIGIIRPYEQMLSTHLEYRPKTPESKEKIIPNLIQEQIYHDAKKINENKRSLILQQQAKKVAKHLFQDPYELYDSEFSMLNHPISLEKNEVNDFVNFLAHNLKNGKKL